MIGVVYAALAIAVVSVAGIIYFGKAALDRADRAGANAELAAQRDGEAKVDADKVAAANTSTTTALAAEHKQEQRGDALEKELSHDQAAPAGDAVDELRALRAGEAGSGAGPDSGRPGK